MAAILTEIYLGLYIPNNKKKKSKLCHLFKGYDDLMFVVCKGLDIVKGCILQMGCVSKGGFVTNWANPSGLIPSISVLHSLTPSLSSYFILCENLSHNCFVALPCDAPESMQKL